MSTTTPERKVLICDDQPMLRSILASTVNELWPNAQIVQAEDGLDGEAKVREHDFDVIFMDVEMPKRNGFDTIKVIRDEGLAEGVPIVVCTGCKGETAVVRGWQLQVDHYITKPFDVDEVDAVLDEIKWRGYTAV